MKMKKRQRTFLRVATSERIFIRQTANGASKGYHAGEAAGSAPPGARYRLEIYRIDDGSERVVFECEFDGPVEFIER
jgi:uncharacterized metal-binding protein YceD (DUF177 family)